jgi:hypothetical protein
MRRFHRRILNAIRKSLYRDWYPIVTLEDWLEERFKVLIEFGTEQIIYPKEYETSER